MSVRKVRHSGSNIIGSFAGLKSRSVSYESTIERDFLYFVECDSSVVSYTSQPFTLRYNDNGKSCSYTPDFLVIRSHDQLVVECKPAREVDTEDTQRQCRIGRSWAKEHDYEFLLITDRVLRAGTQLDNLRILWRYSRLSIPSATKMKCVALLATHSEGVSFLDCATVLSERADSPLAQSPTIYALLFQQILATDLSQPIGPSSQLFLASAYPALCPPDLLSLV